MTTNDFDRLDEALSDPENVEELERAEDVFHQLLATVRRGLHAQAAGDFDGFLDTGLEAAALTLGLDREQIMTILLGAVVTIVQLTPEGVE